MGKLTQEARLRFRNARRDLKYDRINAALDEATQAYASFQLSGDLDGMAECVRIVSHALGRQGLRKQAVQMATEELEKFREKNQKRAEALMLVTLAEIKLNANQKESREEACHLANQARLAFTNLKDIQSDEQAKEACKCFETSQSSIFQTAVLEAISSWYVECGELQLARSFAEQSLAMAQEASSPRREASALRSLVKVYILQGDANSVLGNCLDAAWGPRCCTMARLCLEHQQLDQAESHARTALQLARGLDDRLGHGEALGLLAQEQVVCQDAKDQLGEALCSLSLAHVYMELSKPKEVLASADAASRLFRSIGDNDAAVSLVKEVHRVSSMPCGRKAATLLTCIWKHEDSWLVGAAWGWASRGADQSPPERYFLYLHGFPDQSLDHRIESSHYGQIHPRLPQRLAERLLSERPRSAFVAFNFAGTPGSDDTVSFYEKTVSREVHLGVKGMCRGRG
eukprot:g7290.t1